MSAYYVIHVGRGTDGGFGDYSPPYWSESPVEVDGRTVWFTQESDAKAAVDALNKASSDVFPYVSYSGEFPMEYQYRAITPPLGASFQTKEAVALVTALHGDSWPMRYDDEWEDEEPA